MNKMTRHRCDFNRGKHWHSYLQYESRLLEISRAVLIDPRNNTTFSETFAELLMTIGSSVDTFFRTMSDCPQGLKAKSSVGNKKLSKNMNINDYRDIYEPFFELSQNRIVVPFGLGETQFLSPFEEFSNNQSPQWWSEYNDVKHNYYDNIEKANLLNVLNSLGALLLLNVFHHCSQEYMAMNGQFRNSNGVLSIEEFGNCFHITPKGTDGCELPPSRVYAETKIFAFQFRNFDV